MIDKSNSLKLYKVTANSPYRELESYVVASHESEAASKMLKKLTDLTYDYNFVSKIELIADEYQYGHKFMLII